MLDALARALQLDDAERGHLYDLVRAANAGQHPQRARDSGRPQRIRASLQQTIDAMTGVPVFVQNGRLDAVATNRLGAALFSEMFQDPRRPMNAARFTFLDPRAHTFYRDWANNARQIVAILRGEAGRSPYDRVLSDLVGELSTRSTDFRTLWAAHDVREHRTGVKSIHHPVVGDLDLTFEVLELGTDRGLQMLAFSAAPGSPSHDGLAMLTSWAASTLADAAEQPQRDQVADRR